MLKVVIFIVKFIKGLVILTLPVLMIHTMGEEPYSESFYLAIYVMKCIFSLIATWVISDGVLVFLSSFNTDD